jgi:proteic killer suppression protein
MFIRFDKEYLEELYTNGQCNDKKHCYPPQIVKGYVKCVKLLAQVRRIEDLFRFNALNCETLPGEKKGLSSVRINARYRLVFAVAFEPDTNETIITVCTLIDSMNPYRQRP